jgi:hypothetical protein
VRFDRLVGEREPRRVGEDSIRCDERCADVEGACRYPQIVGVNPISEWLANLSARESELRDLDHQRVGDGNHRRRLDAFFQPLTTSGAPAIDQRPEPQLGNCAEARKI